MNMIMIMIIVRQGIQTNEVDTEPTIGISDFFFKFSIEILSDCWVALCIVLAFLHVASGLEYTDAHEYTIQKTGVTFSHPIRYYEDAIISSGRMVGHAERKLLRILFESNIFLTIVAISIQSHFHQIAKISHIL